MLSKQQFPANDTKWPLRKVQAWGKGGAVVTSPQVEEGAAAFRPSQPQPIQLADEEAKRLAWDHTVCGLQARTGWCP